MRHDGGCAILGAQFVRCADVQPMTEVWLGLWRDMLGALIPEHLL